MISHLSKCVNPIFSKTVIKLINIYKALMKFTMHLRKVTKFTYNDFSDVQARILGFYFRCGNVNSTLSRHPQGESLRARLSCIHLGKSLTLFTKQEVSGLIYNTQSGTYQFWTYELSFVLFGTCQYYSDQEPAYLLTSRTFLTNASQLETAAHSPPLFCHL